LRPSSFAVAVVDPAAAAAAAAAKIVSSARRLLVVLASLAQAAADWRLFCYQLVVAELPTRKGTL